MASLLHSWPLWISFSVVLLAAVAVVLAWDALSAWIASRRSRYPYGWLGPFQLILYLMIGFFAMWLTNNGYATLTIGAIIALVDATAGWTIAWRICPDRVPEPTPGRIDVAAPVLSILGLALAIAGAQLFVDIEFAVFGHFPGVS